LPLDEKSYMDLRCNSRIPLSHEVRAFSFLL